jgi:hypothetical protein
MKPYVQLLHTNENIKNNKVATLKLAFELGALIK